AHLRDADDRGGSSGEPPEPPPRQAVKNERPHRQGPDEPPRLGEVVVRLAWPLRPEVPSGGRSTDHEQVRDPTLAAARRPDGPQHLQVLEQDVTAVAAHGQEGAAAYSERARIVGGDRAIEQGAAG